MLRVDRLSVCVVMFGLIFLIPSVVYFDKTDELTAVALIAIAGLDIVVNGNFRKYKGLLWLMGILGAYAAYSLTLPYNTPRYIATDWVIQLKSFASFFILLAIAPQFTDRDKTIIRGITLVNMAVMSIALCCGNTVVKMLVFHPTYAGTIIFISAAFYVYCSIDCEGSVPRRAIQIVTVALLIGCLCMKAKYLGSVVLTFYFMYIYRTGMMRRFNLKHLVTLLLICASVLAVSWNKIQYYFLTGATDTFDPETVATFARPVMFVTGGMILADHFPFGTGLASFGTAASSPDMNYSGVYFEYGIDKVHGINPNSEESFICDAFYPELAQFGVMGVVLFIYFWVYVYSYLRPMTRFDTERYRPLFIIGSCIICFLLIESVGATTIAHTVGLECLSLLGIVCAAGRELRGRKGAAEPDSGKDMSLPSLRPYKI